MIVWKVRKNKQQKLERVNSQTKEEIKVSETKNLTSLNENIEESSSTSSKNETQENQKVNEINYLTKKEEKVVIKNEESKEDSKKKKKEKLLYTCESMVDGYEVRQAFKYFPELGKGIYLLCIIFATICNLVFFALIAIFFKNLFVAADIFIALEIFYIIFFKLTLGYYVAAISNKQIKKDGLGKKMSIDFYDDYFTRTKEIITYKFYYTDIGRIVETDTNFYLKDIKHNVIIIIQKNRCSLELINFIREKFANLENHLGEDSKFKGVKKYHNPNFIKTFMIILFIITIMCIWGGLFLLLFFNKINPKHGFNAIKNVWVLWCLLPIPILSIILGFKYTKAGFKCTKNIVGGFIVGVYLSLYGLFYFIPTFSEDYSKIDMYRNIIDANLPSNGELEIQNWGTYFDSDKTNYTIINAYYDKENVSSLINSIENSSNWILSNNLKSELKIFIPSTLYSDYDAYYSIYIKTINQYNTLPEVTGNYLVYVMKYDISDKKLEIHKFDYFYNK